MAILTRTAGWQTLLAHSRLMQHRPMRALFAADRERASRFSLEVCQILADFSKNRITEETLSGLCALARERKLEQRIREMFAGEKINRSEGRAALHVALRAPTGAQFSVEGVDVMPQVLNERQRMLAFAERVRHGEHRGCTGQRITHVVNLGIGGSELGPRMVCGALKEDVADIRIWFVSGIDGVQLDDVLRQAPAENTLFIVSSKSFTTQETLLNAHHARDWLLTQSENHPQAVACHFVAVSANREKVTAFGIDAEHIFSMPQWVGGRYSLWSAIGLPIAIQCGAAAFEQLLAGAHAMDRHFLNTPFERNLPVLLALIGIWNINFLGAASHLVAAYHQRLYRLPAYLQQLDMESNGKSVDMDGLTTEYATSPVVWGETGIDGQHAYFQMVHQGTQIVPVDFIGVCHRGEPRHEHDLALAHMLAQAQALMHGRSEEEAVMEMRSAGIDTAAIRSLAAQRSFPGNRPSNILLLQRLDPCTLGALLALYEHRTYTQGVIWHVNSFDQWGVELGKELATGIIEEIDSEASCTDYDASTKQLISYYKKHR